MTPESRTKTIKALRMAAAKLTAARGTYVDTKDLPALVQRALKANGYHSRNIEVIATQRTDLQTFPNDGNRGFNVFIDLARNKVKQETGSWGGGNPYEQKLTDIDNTQRPLPDNVIHIKGEGNGRKAFATIYVNPKTMTPLLPPKEDVSIEEKKALKIVKELKGGGGYRDDEFRYQKLGEYSIKNPLIIRLVAKGLLKQNARGSLMITTKGKNLAASVQSAAKPVDIPAEITTIFTSILGNKPGLVGRKMGKTTYLGSWDGYDDVFKDPKKLFRVLKKLKMTNSTSKHRDVTTNRWTTADKRYGVDIYTEPLWSEKYKDSATQIDLWVEE